MCYTTNYCNLCSMNQLQQNWSSYISVTRVQYVWHFLLQKEKKFVLPDSFFDCRTIWVDARISKRNLNFVDTTNIIIEKVLLCVPKNNFPSKLTFSTTHNYNEKLIFSVRFTQKCVFVKHWKWKRNGKLLSTKLTLQS